MRWIRLAAVIVVLTLVVAACGSGSGDQTSEGESSDSEPASASEGSGTDTGSSVLDSVWPLPPEGTATVLFVYEMSENDLQISETSTFEIAGTDVDTVVRFYNEFFSEMGVIATPFGAGTSIVLNLSYPDNPNVTAVVQVTETQDGSVVTVNQKRSEFKTGGPPSGDAPDTNEPDGTSDDPTGGAMVITDNIAAIDWARVTATFVAPSDGAIDPYFFIHSDNTADGFYLSLELYTVWGQGWTGETGVFEISCTDAIRDTGICVHFDPDGVGPMLDIGADFGARGAVEIRRLDADGYDIDLRGLTFTDGTAVADLTLQG